MILLTGNMHDIVVIDVCNVISCCIVYYVCRKKIKKNECIQIGFCMHTNWKMNA